MARFVMPVLEIYNGGHRLNDLARETILRAYTVACMGFDPEDYDTALIRFIAERSGGTFRPEPAELRKCLIAVHSEKPAAEFERVMWAHYHQPDPTTHRQIWDAAAHGPKPGKSGCRIAQHNQDRVWWEILDLCRRSPGYDVRVRHDDGYGMTGGRLRCPSGFGLLALINRHSPDRIDPRDHECPISRRILREYEIPMTDREIADGKSEFVALVASKREKMLADYRAYLAERARRASSQRKPATGPTEAKPTGGFVSDLLSGI
jgi:hypothetical protein